MTAPVRVRDRFAPLVIFTALFLSPIEAPWSRYDVAAPPAAVLPVGEPTPSIATRRFRRTDPGGSGGAGDSH